MVYLCMINAAASHVAMLNPPSWSDAGGNTGLGNCSAKEGWQWRLGNEPRVPRLVGSGSTSALAWFNNYTWIEAPTLDPALRTWQDATQSYLHKMKDGLGWMNFLPELISGGFLNKPLPTEGTVDLTKLMPWRAPGFAPLQSPCGVAGGNGRGFTALVGELFTESARMVDMDGGLMEQTSDGGYGWGPDARIYKFRDVVETEWKRGSVVSAAWGIWANHGGGYSYRLCKIPAEGRAGLTEECFQQTPLDFVGDTQWAQWGENESTRVAFKANRTRHGTWPAGSQWTKNPVPVCRDPTGGELSLSCPDCSRAGGYQFPPPAPGVYGYGICELHGTYTMPFAIVDQLHVPLSITEGQYALSFRYDAEQTPQVWNTCASIRIV
jgi:hypothetical protein